MASDYDQPVILTAAESSLLSNVDRQMKKAIKSGNIQIVEEQINMLRRQGQMTGVALAKALWLWRENCEAFEIDRLDWEDLVYARTGISVQTARKYSDMWYYLFEQRPLDETMKMRLLSQPVQSLLLIGPSAKEGNLDDDDWEALANAEDQAAIKEIVRRKHGGKGRTSAKNAIVIRLKRDGTLEARKGEGNYIGFGFLNLKLEDPVAVAAITRIINGAGVMQV